jgi:hypothetical protein
LDSSWEARRQAGRQGNPGCHWYGRRYCRWCRRSGCRFRCSGAGRRRAQSAYRWAAIGEDADRAVAWADGRLHDPTAAAASHWSPIGKWRAQFGAGAAVPAPVERTCAEPTGQDHAAVTCDGFLDWNAGASCRRFCRHAFEGCAILDFGRCADRPGQGLQPEWQFERRVRRQRTRMRTPHSRPRREDARPWLRRRAGELCLVRRFAANGHKLMDNNRSRHRLPAVVRDRDRELARRGLIAACGNGRFINRPRAGGARHGRLHRDGVIRRLPGVITTRVGYTGGDVPNATYCNHGTHAAAMDRSPSIYRSSAIEPCLSSSSKFTTQRRATARATTWVRAIIRRSSSRAMSSRLAGRAGAPVLSGACAERLYVPFRPPELESCQSVLRRQDLPKVQA